MKVEPHLEKDATPIFCKTWTVTDELRVAVNEELQSLLDEDIKPVPSSKWVIPIVPVVKLNEKIYLCGDFKITLKSIFEIKKISFGYNRWWFVYYKYWFKPSIAST